MLERYVLGTLEEDARTVLRAQVIADPNVFAEVREVELDLLDAATRDPVSAEGEIAEAHARAEDAVRVALVALREAFAAWWTHVRIWPAAAVWLAIAMVSLTFSPRSALDLDSAASFTPAATAQSTVAELDAALSDAQGSRGMARPLGQPFLRIDFSLSSGRLNAFVTVPSGMFAGLWSLEIDSVQATRRQP